MNAWTFSAEITLAEAAKRTAEAGFTFFEPTINPEGELTPTTDESACRQLAEQIRGAGLKIHSVATGLFWHRPFTSPDAAVRAEARALALAALDRAAWLGAGILLIVPGVVGRHSQPGLMHCGYVDALNRSYEALRGLAYEAERRGVALALENVWNHFLLSPVELAEFIDRIGSPWVGAYLDTGNVLRYGFPQDWIRILGRRILGVHLKDFRVQVGTAAGFCPLGEGDVCWPEVRAALRAIRYRGPLIHEGPGEPAEIAARIRRILGDHAV